MTADPKTPDPTPDPTPAPTPAGEPPAAAPAATSPNPPTPPAAGGGDTLSEADLDSLDARTQAYIKKLREENMKDRLESKQKAADEARQELTQKIGKALGLVEDPDPSTVAEKVAAEREAAKQEAKVAKIELAVIKAALKHEANPEALTDSRGFMSKLADLDPGADDFAAKVEAAVQSTLEANPTLKAAPIVPARSGGPVGGGSATPGQLTEEDLNTMSREEIAKAKAEGRLNEVLGIR